MDNGVLLLMYYHKKNGEHATYCATNCLLQHTRKRHIVFICVCVGRAKLPELCLFVTSVSLISRCNQIMDFSTG